MLNCVEPRACLIVSFDSIDVSLHERPARQLTRFHRTMDTRDSDFNNIERLRLEHDRSDK
jgi:hypothetical protein